MALRHLTATLAGALVLAGAVGIAAPGVAAAAVQQGIGFDVVPSQPYLNSPPLSQGDWTGSYMVGGQQVWCIDFAFNAPQSNQQYTDGTTLTTKFGQPVPATTAAEISYLLLRFGNTKSADDATALAQLLHTWTAGPTSSVQLDPTTNDFRHIAYDVNYHLSKLPKSAQTEVAAMQTDAAANHGPWTASMTAPTDNQVIGRADNWSFQVLNTTKKGVASVPVTITATDATLPNGTSTQTMMTPADGSPLTVAVTPTGANPKLATSVDSPAAMPKVRVPVNAPDVQKIVTTGGTTPVTTTTTTTANTPPGQVTLTKLDSTSKAPIAGVAVELTGADKKNPPLQQNGAPLAGANGKPEVLSTNSSGQVTVQNLHTPQNVCFVEVTPAPGFDQAFNPASPPTVCANVGPGQTVQLTLTNVPNKVPIAIPAGGPPPTMTALSSTLNKPAPTALILFGGLLVIVAGSTGLVVARRRRR